MGSDNTTKGETVGPENAGRRKAVKTIVGGVTALAAYNVLPAKWGTPIIESVFLPAHAATSGQADVMIGPCTITSQGLESVPGGSGYNWNLTLSGFVTPPTPGTNITIIRTYNEVDGDKFTDDLSSFGFYVTTDSAGNFTFKDQKDMTQLASMEYTVSIDGVEGSSTCSMDAPPVP